jgi:hypothetical protein
MDLLFLKSGPRCGTVSRPCHPSRTEGLQVAAVAGSGDLAATCASFETGISPNSLTASPLTRRPDGSTLAQIFGLTLAKSFAFPKRDRSVAPAGDLSTGPGCNCALRVITFLVNISETIMLTSNQTCGQNRNRNCHCDQAPNLCHFVSMFAKARCVCRKRRRIKELRYGPQWRALCPGHKKTQKPGGGRVRAHSAFTHFFARAITHFAALCALFLRRRCRRGNLPTLMNLCRSPFSKRNRPRAKARMSACRIYQCRQRLNVGRLAGVQPFAERQRRPIQQRSYNGLYRRVIRDSAHFSLIVLDRRSRLFSVHFFTASAVPSFVQCRVLK